MQQLGMTRAVPSSFATPPPLLGLCPFGALEALAFAKRVADELQALQNPYVTRMPVMSGQVTFRFYEELNDFLPLGQRKLSFAYSFNGRPTVKDAIEALGVPHCEVELILANGKAVTFAYHIQAGDRIAVYPVFESFDIASLCQLRAKPLRRPRFIVDANLGKLAKYLRLLGFDALYDRNADDLELIITAKAHQRVILTRDRALLKHGQVSHGLWVRSHQPREQLREVVARLQLQLLATPFVRCLRCNGELRSVAKEKVFEQLPPLVSQTQIEFYQCQDCRQVFWPGSHHAKLKVLCSEIVKGSGDLA